MKKIGWIVFFVLLFGCIGYMREFFFVHMNNIMWRKYHNTDSTLAIPGSMHVFENFSYTTLYYSKYVYTLIWIFIFFISSHFALKVFSHNPLGPKLLRYAYILMLVIAGLSMAYGALVNQRLQNEEYTLSRWLLGIAQSPVICLILLASEKLYNKSIYHD